MRWYPRGIQRLVSTYNSQREMVSAVDTGTSLHIQAREMVSVGDTETGIHIQAREMVSAGDTETSLHIQFTTRWYPQGDTETNLVSTYKPVKGGG